MPIDTPHPDYVAESGRWQRCRDLASGTDAIKTAGRRYLPQPAGMDGAAYSAYLERAHLYGAFPRTLVGLVGAIHQKAPVVTAPTNIAGHIADVSLTNESLEMFAQRATREVLETGRLGILVDMAGAEAVEPTRPYWVLYKAEQIRSWHTARRGGDEQLVRVVLEECKLEPIPDDPYVLEYATQYREVFLNGAGECAVRIWTRLPGSHLVDPAQTVWIPGAPIPMVRRGEPLRFLPFVFFNAAGLSPDVSRPPLIDLVDTVISHFRNSADKEHALFFVSAPTPVVSGAPTGTSPLRIGASTGWLLEKGATAQFLEFSGAGVAAQRENMEEKLRMMAVLGARMLEDQAGSRVEASRTIELRHAGEHATLRQLAQIIEQGLTCALQIHGWWQGSARRPSDVDARVELLKDYFNVQLDAPRLTALMGAFQGGGMSFSTFFHNLQQGEMIPPGRTEEEELKLIEVEERQRLQFTKEELEAQYDRE